MTKKIIIDAFQDMSIITGTDRMAYNLLTELQKLDHINSYYVICSNEEYTRSSLHSPNFKIIKPKLLFKNRIIKKVYLYRWRKTALKRLQKIEPDVYYSFHNMRLPHFRVAKKMITSNLDLIPLVLDDYRNLGRLSETEKLKEYQRVADNTDGFVSISEFSKHELSTLMNVPKNKISVIYLAADKSFGEKQPLILLESIGLDSKKYILTNGGSEPRKNVETIIKAYKLLPKDLQAKYQLIIVGGSWHGRGLPGIDDKNIKWLKYVSDELFVALYQNASTFIFASTYEGFGLTILEAMASKVPIVRALGSSLDEVAGSATLSFNPQNSRELCDKIVRLLRDKKLQKELVSKGEIQYKKFSWEVAGQKLHRLLNEL